MLLRSPSLLPRRMFPTSCVCDTLGLSLRGLSGRKKSGAGDEMQGDDNGPKRGGDGGRLELLRRSNSSYADSKVCLEGNGKFDGDGLDGSGFDVDGFAGDDLDGDGLDGGDDGS